LLIYVYDTIYNEVCEVSTEPARAQSGRLKELISMDTVERVANAIEKNIHVSSFYRKLVFAIAMKEAGLNPNEILSEAAEKLIEATRRKTGGKPPVHEGTIISWLAAWREPGNIHRDLLKMLVFLRLIVIGKMIEGKMWIKEVGENLMVVTDGESEYYIGNGLLWPK